MRLINLAKGDLRFILKYGIAFVYVLITVLYLLLLGAIPENARGIIASILIFTDPAAMGLFFMGAFVMLEKSQRVNASLAVSPVTYTEYILSKAFSLLIPGTIVGSILCAFAAPENLILAVPAIGLSSVLFSLCGLFAAVKADTLNGFMIDVIPFEILISLPAVLYAFDVIRSPLWILHPGIAAMRMIEGNSQYWYLCILSLILWSAAIYYLSRNAVKKSFEELGGGKAL